MKKRLPPAVRDKPLQSGKFTMASLLRSALVNKEPQAKIFFTVEEVSFLMEMAWVPGANQCAKEQGVESEHERFFGAAAVFTYQQGLGEAFFAKRAAEVQYRGYVILEWFGTFAKAPKKGLESPD